MQTMSFLRINRYTRVLDDGKKTLDERKDLINNQSLCKSSEFKIEKVKTAKTPNNYKKFCNKVFEERSFISKKEFNNLILESFGSNPTYYRTRMIDLGLIVEQNKVIKSAI